MIHNAYTDALELLQQHATVKGDVHFFAGSIAEADMFIALGFTLSFNGVITFTHDYDAVIKHVPLDMLLSETDAPYVTPTPHRGKRNEPAYVSLAVKRIAEIKELPFEQVAFALVTNARRVFDI
jgi:TatD DNase family protein